MLAWAKETQNAMAVVQMAEALGDGDQTLDEQVRKVHRDSGTKLTAAGVKYVRTPQPPPEAASSTMHGNEPTSVTREEASRAKLERQRQEERDAFQSPLFAQAHPVPKKSHPSKAPITRHPHPPGAKVPAFSS